VAYTDSATAGTAMRRSRQDHRDTGHEVRNRDCCAQRFESLCAFFSCALHVPRGFYGQPLVPPIPLRTLGRAPRRTAAGPPLDDGRRWDGGTSLVHILWVVVTWEWNGAGHPGRAWELRCLDTLLGEMGDG